VAFSLGVLYLSGTLGVHAQPIQLFVFSFIGLALANIGVFVVNMVAVLHRTKADATEQELEAHVAPALQGDVTAFPAWASGVAAVVAAGCLAAMATAALVMLFRYLGG